MEIPLWWQYHIHKDAKNTSQSIRGKLHVPCKVKCVGLYREMSVVRFSDFEMLNELASRVHWYVSNFDQQVDSLTEMIPLGRNAHYPMICKLNDDVWKDFTQVPNGKITTMADKSEVIASPRKSYKVQLPEGINPEIAAMLSKLLIKREKRNSKQS